MEQGKEKDGAEECVIDHELVEARIGNTKNIFERVLSGSEWFKCVKDLSSFPDLFSSSD
jgi:hypothetical protein